MEDTSSRTRQDDKALVHAMMKTKEFGCSGKPKKFAFCDRTDELLFLGPNKSFQLGLNAISIKEQPADDIYDKVKLFFESDWKEVVTFPSFGAEMNEAYSKEEVLRRERQRIVDVGITDYSYNDSHQKVLIPSSGGRLWFADLSEKPVTDSATQLQLIGDEKDDSQIAKIDAKWCPDCSMVSYIQDGDIWVTELASQKSLRVTHSRKDNNKISAGVAEFIMEEEFSRYSGYEWCPKVREHDGSRRYSILYAEVDETQVPTVHIANTDISKPADEYSYPRPGEPNAVSQMHVVHITVENNKTISDATIEDFTCSTINGRFPWTEYIVRFGWTCDDRFWVQCLDRNQARINLSLYDVEHDCHPTNIPVGQASDVNMDTLTLIEETSEIWINVTDICHFLEDGSGVIWASERTGYRHLYFIPLTEQTEHPEPITAGDWVVADSKIWVDEKNKLVFFTGWMETPLRAHLYVASYANRNPRAIQRLTTAGYHHSEVSMNSTCTRFVTTYSNINEQPVTNVYGVEVLTDASSSSSQPQFCNVSKSRTIRYQTNNAKEPYPFNPPELRTIHVDGTTLHGCVFKPPDFDKTKKYPLIVYVYGGPHVQLVQDCYKGLTSKSRYQMLASLGYVVAILDSRGSWGRGLEFEGRVRYKMGQIEMHDQVTFVKDLIRDGFVDKDRICIHGWSYGGYLTLIAMATYPDVFKLGISGAPVTKWEYYDTGYTERYMGLPQDNMTGYRKGSVLNLVHSFPDEENRLAIVHGLMDENVHFAHTGTLIEAFIGANKPYILKMFPFERHGLRSVRSAMYYELFFLQFIHARL